jgi:hypothetical protein
MPTTNELWVGALRDSGGNFLDSNLSSAARLVFHDNRKHKKSLGLTAAAGQIMMRKENNGLGLLAHSQNIDICPQSLSALLI